MLTPGSGGSIRLFDLFGIPVRVHFTFLFLVVWFGVYTASRGEPATMPFLVFGLLLLSVVLHELGHALVARRFGIATREIVLYPIGGIARLDSMPSGQAELLIAAAGPLVNLVLGLLLVLGIAAAGVPWSLSGELSATLPWTATANFALFVFNLLPAFPMDGGRILRAFLSLIVGEEKATVFATRLGQGLAVVMALVAVFGPARNLVLLLIALFVFFGASQESAFFRTRSLVRGRSAGEAMMTSFETVAPQDSLEWAVRLFLATHQRDFPVIDAWGRVAGLLDRASLLRGLAAFGRDGAVLEAMDRQPPQVRPDTPLEEVFRTLTGLPQRVVLVVDGDRLRGLVTFEKLMQLIEVLPRI